MNADKLIKEYAENIANEIFKKGFKTEDELFKFFIQTGAVASIKLKTVTAQLDIAVELLGDLMKIHKPCILETGGFDGIPECRQHPPAVCQVLFEAESIIAKIKDEEVGDDF